MPIPPLPVRGVPEREAFARARRRWRRGSARSLPMLLVIALAVSHGAPAVAAEEPVPDESQVEVGIQEGIALRKSGQDEAALEKFLELEQRDPDSIRILLHITAAAQATGKWLMAHAYLRKASARKNDPYYLRHRAAIKTIEDSIAQRVGQFRVLGAPAGASVRLNGQLVGTLPMQEPKAVEVGSYVLEVAKPGYYPLRRPIVVASGNTLSQEAVELGEARAGEGADPGAVRLSTTSGPGGQPERRGWSSSWVSWTLVGVTAASAATSGVAFALREKSAKEWNDDSRCLDQRNITRTREDECGDVRRDANVAQAVGIGAGVAAVGFGAATLVHWLSTRTSSSTASASTAPSSGCGAGLDRIICYGSF